MKTLLSLLLLLLISGACPAQYYSNYNKVWAFGWKAGLDFTSGIPVPIATGIAPPQLAEGCASVCDSLGHLLFYTNGSEVYNRNHVVMPTGTAIIPFATYSTTQGALIAPVIGYPNKYYLFSLQQFTLGDTATCRLFYCIVDMTLDGGLGDVVSSSKETFVADSLCEKMIAVTGSDNNIWLLAHMKDTAIFKAFEITPAGVNMVPVVSATGSFKKKWSYVVGVMKASPNRRRIVSQTVNQISSLHGYGTELYDFDPSTGVVSNCRVLDSTHSVYGAEFSPDNTKLYSHQKASDTVLIYQYNVGLPTVAAMRSSKTLIAVIPRAGGTDLKLGPDNKIYFIANDTFSSPVFSRFLDCISLPNLPGTSCGYVYRAVTMVPGTGMQMGLPNLYVTEDTNYVAPTLATNGAAIGNTAMEISLIPNPATTALCVSATQKISHIRILDVLGREVYKSDHIDNFVRLDLSSLSPDIYFIEVNKQIVRKFQKW